MCNPADGSRSPRFKPAGASCDDATACNGREVCDAAGPCRPGTPVVCLPLDQCHDVGVGDPTSGVRSTSAKPDGMARDDGNASTCNDVCADETCAGTPTDYQTDPAHYRGCGRACGANLHCAGGACACDVGFTTCQLPFDRSSCGEGGCLDQRMDCSPNGNYDRHGECCPSAFRDRRGDCCHGGILAIRGDCCCDGSTPGENGRSTGYC